jgi:hypothetical protein
MTGAAPRLVNDILDFLFSDHGILRLLFDGGSEGGVDPCYDPPPFPQLPPLKPQKSRDDAGFRGIGSDAE